MRPLPKSSTRSITSTSRTTNARGDSIHSVGGLLVPPSSSSPSSPFPDAAAGFDLDGVNRSHDSDHSSHGGGGNHNNNNNNSMNSSFEVQGYYNSKSKSKSSYKKQQQQRQQSDDQPQGAVQFVPAYQEALSPPLNDVADHHEKNGKSSSPSPSCIDRMIAGAGGGAGSETSWDDIANDPTTTHRSGSGDRLKSTRSSAGPARTTSTTTPTRTTNNSTTTPGRRRYSSSMVGASSSTPIAAVTPSPNGVGDRHRRSSSSNNKSSSVVRKAISQQQRDETTATNTKKNGKGGGSSRIARLASLFSSRAVVMSKDDGSSSNNSTGSGSRHSRKAPSSAALGSESSSGYVGWPGTQDKRGTTVVPLESSYEESETGAPPPLSPLPVGGGGSGGVKDYQREVNEAVDREVSNWMTQDAGHSFDSSSTQQSSPQQQQHQQQPKAKSRNALPLVRTSALSATPAFDCRLEEDKIHRLTAPKSHSRLLDRTIQSVEEVYGQDVNNHSKGDVDPSGRSVTVDDEYNVIATMTEPWSDTMSDLSTSYSKTSSAYFNHREVQAIRKGRTNQVSGVRQNKQAAASVLRRFPANQSQPPTEEALAINNHFSPPVRTFNASNATGYRGLLHKTENVPNLMDDVDSDSTSAASAATSTARTSSQMGSSISGAGNYFRKSRYSRGQQHSRQQTIPEGSSGITFQSSSADKSVDFESESDVFDGLSNVGGDMNSSTSLRLWRHQANRLNPSPEENEEDHQGMDQDGIDPPGLLGATSRADMESVSVALLGGGLTTIQTTANDFTNRKTASDFDENLTNSDVDQYGNYKLPAFHEMAAAGKSYRDSALSSQSLSFAQPSARAKKALELKIQRTGSGSGIYSALSGSQSSSAPSFDPYSEHEWGPHSGRDLSRYYIHPDKMKALVKKFRKMSRERFPHLDYEDLEREEDATKAFALSEMRSRIMEVDIERGLERRGGTTVVDDIVLTPFNRASLRVRDAVIVAKAWRDGATPQDVISTSLLTRRDERSYYIPRLEQQTDRGVSMYTWEEVAWVDDMELSQYRCHSIGPRHLKGAEMFTIGDCQSILLKLCNQQCQELRCDLNDATARQIEAEDAMKAEGETFDGMMTEAEMTYLSTMEVVKAISHKLVLAEKAFTLVKDRIDRLIAKYEALLVHFEGENDSVAPSSIFTYESSYISEAYSFATAEEREKEALAKRAQRAELRAEVAAREALLPKQEVRATRDEKERELRGLRARLADLQSESSAAITEREHSIVLARAITANNRPGVKLPQPNNNTSGVAGAGRINRSKIDDIKRRFRDRSAAKQGQSINDATRATSSMSQYPIPGSQKQTPQQSQRNNMYRAVGEEMFQHLDFYERSLKAVEG